MNTNWIKTNYPYFLTGFGVAGMFASIGLAIVATPKADAALRERREELGVEKLPVKEIVKTAWRPYLWTGITALSSAGCLVGGTIGLTHNFTQQKMAMLGTAASTLSVSEGMNKLLQKKLEEKVGEEEAKQIKEEAVKEVYREHVVSYDIFETKGPGQEVYLEPYTGQWFVLTPEEFERAWDNINHQLFSGLDKEVMLHELFAEWGMQQTDIGWMMSFKQNAIPFDTGIEHDLTPMVDRYGRSYLVIEYITKPTWAV